MLAAIGRNTRLRERPEIQAAIRGLLPQPDAAAALLPVLGRPEFSDAERLDVIDRGWNRLTPPQRLTALELLFGRPRASRPGRSSRAGRGVCSVPRTDPSPSVRERTLAGLNDLPPFRSGRARGPVAPERRWPTTRRRLRKLGLALAASKGSFWDRADATEHLARLLVDPDATVRSQALDLVKHHRPGRQAPAPGAQGQGPGRGPRPRGPRRGRPPRRGPRSGRGAGRRRADQTAAAQPGDIPPHGEPDLLPGRRRRLRLRQLPRQPHDPADRRGRPGHGILRTSSS